jgi:two-component system nitrate/nitrite response regulator NarL
MIPPFTIAIVGERVLMRAGLAHLLTDAGHDVGAQASTVAELAPMLISDKPLLLLLDVIGDELPLSDIALARDHYSDIHIALLADRRRLASSTLSRALRAGVHAVMQQPSLQVLLKTLELVMLGETIVPSDWLQEFLSKDLKLETKTPAAVGGAPRLSPREQSILDCLIEGRSNKAIARTVGIADATVKVHIKSIFSKIGVSNRTQAAIWATNRGLVPDPSPGLVSGMLNGVPSPMVAAVDVIEFMD